ncbi:MAG: exodeoxyribonuclease V subunit gamma [Proteobacteria bacterium]|nr:exodeoxyribonuclease V subunit gamma [Pseudomonadota bacterium]
MPGLKLFVSNRLEVLADKLAEVLKTPLPSPLEKEIIVVQSKGMERWVSMQLASRRGICANCSFPFPNAFVHEIFRKVLPEIPERSPFDPKIMTWRIMKLLPSCISKPGFESLGIYLRNTEEKLKLFQLSARIADTFDQYLIFRPQMIFGWEQGTDEHWQAVLWRELLKESDKWHRAELGRYFFKVVKNSSRRIEGLPERISVFGISALPRFHMEVFSNISLVTRVNLFLANPCKEYWGVILSDWEMRKRTLRQSPRDLNDKELHLEKGNSLLASMGTLGRDFFDLVNEFQYEEWTSFEDGREDNLLSCIQSDILNLIDRPQIPDKMKTVRSSDSSIQFHSCHSPMREIEVLHDQLLNMFETVPGLMPRDILVMTPDIETYSPYIQAVFDISTDDARWIPFSIADRSVRKESEIIDTFLAIIDIWGTRFSASQVLAILDSQAVRGRFGLLESDLELVRRWVKEIRIRWGIDGESRSQMGLPAFPENTWRAGLEQLLLGYAIPGHEKNLFGGILPYDHIEGREALVLGKFLEFTEQLFSHVTSLGRPQTLDDWSEALNVLLEGFFMPEEDTEREMQVIRRVLKDLADMEEVSGFHEKIDINVIKWHLRHSFESTDLGFGFISGGVTFCALLPMRSIPFKVICLVGMNNDAYPRQSKPLGFDLMAKHPEPGDRSRRNDDRYLFLEAVLSTREKLYISYVGQSIQDNSLIPPSVLVSELMDYIEQGFNLPGKNIQKHFFTKHRLQAFSPEYFKKNEKLFSYSRETLRAARCILKTRETPVPYISRELSGPGEEWKSIDLNDLYRFFANPAEFLLKRRLGIYLEKKESVVEEREPFDIKGLEKYLLEEKLLKGKLTGLNPGDFCL